MEIINHFSFIMSSSNTQGMTRDQIEEAKWNAQYESTLREYKELGVKIPFIERYLAKPRKPTPKTRRSKGK